MLVGSPLGGSLSRTAQQAGIRPVFALDFLGTALDPRVAFTRAGTATYVDADGILRTAAANVPRLDHDPATRAPKGLLIEDARVNKQTAANVNPTATTGLTKSGAAGATLSVVNDAAALTAAGLSALCTSGTVYRLDNSTGATAAEVALPGAAGGTGAHSVSAYWRGTGTGMVRLAGDAPPASVALPAAYARYQRSVASTTADATLAIRAEAGAIVLFVLQQLEDTTAATSAIPVAGGATASRAVETATVTSGGTPFAGFLAGAGTLVTEATYPPSTGVITAVASLDDATANERIQVRRSTTGASNAIILDGGVTQAQIGGAVLAVGAVVKQGLAWSANDFFSSTVGAFDAVDTIGTIPSVTRLSLGEGTGVTQRHNGHIRRVAYYARRVSNAQLMKLTA